MKKIIVLLIAALALAVTYSPVRANDSSSERLLVFGDSMTAHHTNDFGDPMQGWWSIVAERRGWEVETSAQGGGGLIKKGFGCYGTAVRERAAKTIAQERPTKIIVAVGYNDRHVCIDGRAVEIAPDFRTRAAASAFEAIGAAAESVGMSRSDVYVTVPWGTLNVTTRNPVVTTYKEGAQAAGLTFINVRRFDSGETRDGTHPNRVGSELVADSLSSVQ